ncbi:PP2C family serine/threonine-protein phosphatase [Blastococcus sp. LR1]|uniref:PP2C family protein-serine/threonine phosphatase n=1 Tax=Blastococcus sp. LR1 TaxID=2877000 RepID=UPI001CCF1993|nr:protein phosphatase 2C domain-containing protein [Blastococcus sp. LR1]MCA0144891.1 protein phosphatase 2C domain-containing protein [Blastococcus sp. LR1]
MLPDLTWAVASDVGRRQENQDRCLGAPPVFAVADGMGGHAGGAQASELAVARLGELAQSPTVSVEAIQAALERADDDIAAMGKAIGATNRPGTTVAGIALVEGNGSPLWAAFHVGDSRVYRWGAEGLERVSSDHSVVQRLIDAGQITEERALTHPQRHMITRALGFGDRAGADVTLLPVEDGQRFLLCSDGLTGDVDDGRIAELMAADTDEQALADGLVDVALRAGAHDNVSVVVVRVHGFESADEQAGGRAEEP